MQKAVIAHGLEMKLVAGKGFSPLLNRILGTFLIVRRPSDGARDDTDPFEVI